MNSPRRAAWLLVLATAFLTAGCAMTPKQPPLTTSARVDLDRFMGSWHVIANIPYWPERGKVATRDEYALRADGRIDNDFVFRKDFDQPEKRWNGVSSVVEGSDGAHWKVQFIWPFKADLLVLEVDPNYRWALLGNPKRSMAWIFGREPVMADALYADLRARFNAYGYDPAQLQRVPQVAAQQGQPGFQ
jgi:apolipoprotein D and lipocalin family protein